MIDYREILRESSIGLVLMVMMLSTGGATAQRPPDSPLDRPARLDVARIQLAVAIRTLAANSGVNIAFSPDLLPERTVSCSCVSLTVREAIDSLLAGTSIRYHENRNQIVIAGVRLRTVEGHVRLATDGSPVARARVGVPQHRMVETRTDGSFSIELPADTVRLRVERLGIVRDSVIVAPDVTTLDLRVDPACLTIAPLVARAEIPDREQFVSTAQMSSMTFEREIVKRIPGIAEADVVRAVQAMPGTVAKNDFSLGYNVRGGESDQNLIRLDGVTVINPVHLGGVFSTFDANAFDHVTFLTGGFPAEYSGRLSSVLDLRVRNGADKFSGFGQVSLLSSKLLLQGPVGSGTYLVSARRTYADQVVRTFTRFEVPYYFTDILAKTTVPIAGGTFATTAYWGRDVLDLRVADATEADSTPFDLVFDWGNRLAGTSWTRNFGSAILETRASISEFSSVLGLFPDLAQFDNEVRLLSASTRLGVDFGGLGHVDVGASIESGRTRFNVQTPQFELRQEDLEIIGFLPVLNREYKPLVRAAFLDYQVDVNGRLLVRPGLRVEDIRGINGPVIAPRITAKLFLTRQHALSAAVGRYYQSLHSLRDQDLPLTLFEFWIGADSTVPAARSDQLVLGYEGWFDAGHQLVVEGYRKGYVDLLIPNRAYSLRDDGDEFLRMTGDSWGVDVMLRRHRGNVRGWIGYGFSKSTRRVGEETFPPAHDRRHTINVVLETPGPLGADMTTRWSYGSGLPFTEVVGEWQHYQYSLSHHAYTQQRTEAVVRSRNGARFPSYSRLDAGLHWELGGPGFHWRPYFQVANAYNRRNVFFYAFEYGARPPTRTTVVQLPIFPTFGMEFAW